jgi:hypothetical protein
MQTDSIRYSSLCLMRYPHPNLPLTPGTPAFGGERRRIDFGMHVLAELPTARLVGSDQGKAEGLPHLISTKRQLID